MSTSEIDTNIVPLSQFSGHMGLFVKLLAYPPGRQAELQHEGDVALLDRLDDARSGRPIGDLDEDVLAAVLVAINDEFFERFWRLAGAEDEPLTERLDNHFLPRQRAFAERQAQARAVGEVRARSEGEAKLTEMRGWIGFERAGIAEAQARVDAMEHELAAAASRWGQEAWPA